MQRVSLQLVYPVPECRLLSLLDERNISVLTDLIEAISESASKKTRMYRFLTEAYRRQLDLNAIDEMPAQSKRIDDIKHAQQLFERFRDSTKTDLKFGRAANDTFFIDFHDRKNYGVITKSEAFKIKLGVLRIYGIRFKEVLAFIYSWRIKVTADTNGDAELTSVKQDLEYFLTFLAYNRIQAITAHNFPRPETNLHLPFAFPLDETSDED
jgi:hypothetical protein